MLRDGWNNGSMRWFDGRWVWNEQLTMGEGRQTNKRGMQKGTWEEEQGRLGE